jgi:hypothetical protein
LKSRPRLSSRTRCQAFRVGARLLVDDIREPPFQASQGFHGGFASGEFARLRGMAAMLARIKHQIRERRS